MSCPVFESTDSDGPAIYAGGEESALSPSSEERLLPLPSTEPQVSLPSPTQGQLSTKKFPANGQQASDVGDMLSGKVPKAGLSYAMNYNFLQNHYRPAEGDKLSQETLIKGKDKKPKTLTFQLPWFDLHSWLVYRQSMPGRVCKFCLLFATETHAPLGLLMKMLMTNLLGKS